MSINALGFASKPVAAAAPQLAVPAIGDEPKTPADIARERAEAAAAQQKATLDEVREKGLYAWAQEKKFEALKARVEKELLAERGIDENALAGMTSDERDAVLKSLEQEISKRIQEVMRDALESESKAAAAEGRPAKPMIIDISV